MTATRAATQTVKTPQARRRRPESGIAVDTVRFDDLRALVRVEGDLDPATAAPLLAVLRGHLASGRRFLRLDLSGVRFLDPAALAGVLTAHEQALAARGTLVLTGVRSLVGRALRRAGLDTVLFVSGPRTDDDTTGRFDLRD